MDFFRKPPRMLVGDVRSGRSDIQTRHIQKRKSPSAQWLHSAVLRNSAYSVVNCHELSSVDALNLDAITVIGAADQTDGCGIICHHAARPRDRRTFPAPPAPARRRAQ